MIPRLEELEPRLVPWGTYPGAIRPAVVALVVPLAVVRPVVIPPAPLSTNLVNGADVGRSFNLQVSQALAAGNLGQLTTLAATAARVFVR